MDAWYVELNGLRVLFAPEAHVRHLACNLLRQIALKYNQPKIRKDIRVQANEMLHGTLDEFSRGVYTVKVFKK
jgi:hypothetical protein